MEDELKSKISTAMSNTFVGNFIFSQDELTVLYDDIGYKLRSLATKRGNVLSQVDYDELFVVLVNLAKEWDSDENAFFEYIYKKLLGTSMSTGKIYNQIILAINNLARRNKIFLLNSFIKKYYATICSHAFAPKSSTESFFDMCWEIYCNDLDQQYEENDPTFELIANALNNRFVGMAEENDNLQIGSQVYSFRAGIKGLAIDQKPLMVKLIETVIKTIDAIFNSSPIDLNLYISCNFIVLLNVIISPIINGIIPAITSGLNKNTNPNIIISIPYNISSLLFFIELYIIIPENIRIITPIIFRDVVIISSGIKININPKINKEIELIISYFFIH